MLGMGLKAAIAPVFAAEVAPPHLRGSLVMVSGRIVCVDSMSMLTHFGLEQNWQLFDAFGYVRLSTCTKGSLLGIS